MSGGYAPKVVHPDEYKIQTQSGGFQKPFYFGASQVPTALNLHPNSFSGAGLTYRYTDPTSKLNKIKLVLPR
jgi:hypothetical protein